MAGVNTEKYNNRYLSVKRMDLITESVPEIGTATGEDKINEASAYTWATAGFFGRINYDYSNKYLLLVTYAMTVLLVSSEKTVGDCSVRFL